MFSEKDPIFEPLQLYRHGFPSTWRYILPKQFGQLKLPNEQLADCDACPMVALGEFLPSCRCCTHLAQIPNFQLGLALLDPRTESHARHVIQQGYALPVGIEITPSHYVFSVAAHKKNMFGKSEALLCPFMNRNTGACTAYAYRTSVCSTFHCAHDHCDVGADLWERIEELASRAEHAVRHWAMGKVGLAPQTYMNHMNELASQMDGLAGEHTRTWSKALRARLFGRWFGNEEQFFVACAQQVMAHRDELWKIACEMPVFEASKYEDAADNLLPKTRLESQGAPLELGEDTPEESHDADEANDSDEPVSLMELWTELQHDTEQLWRLPNTGVQLRLNQHVRIGPNPQDDALSRLYRNKPTKLVCSRVSEDGEAVEPLVVFLTAIETDALVFFENPQTMEQSLYKNPSMAALTHPREFLAESLRAEIICEV